MHLGLLARRDLALDPGEAPAACSSLARSSRALRSGRTAVRSSTASSLSTTLPGSAKTETVLTSVASVSPLRSMMSGRAAAIAAEASRRMLPEKSGATASMTSRPAMTANSAEKPTATRPDPRRALVEPQAEQLARRSPRLGRSAPAPARLRGVRRWSKRQPTWSYLRRRSGRGRARAAGLLVLRGLGRFEKAESLQLAADLVAPLRPVRKVRHPGELIDVQGLQVEVLVRNRLQAVGPIQKLPLRLQNRDGVALACWTFAFVLATCSA